MSSRYIYFDGKTGDLFYLKYKYSLLIETDTVVFHLSVVDHRLDSLESYTIRVRSIQRTNFLCLVELLTIIISSVYFEHIFTVVTFNRSTYLVNLSHRNHSVQVRFDTDTSDTASTKVHELYRVYRRTHRFSICLN